MVEKVTQLVRVAAPISSVPYEIDNRPTPIAQAIAMKCEIPPESTPVEIDQRIDRLLSENLALMTERKQLRHHLKDVQKRSTELLMEARSAKRLVRSMLDHVVLLDAPEMDDVYDLEELKTWAAKPL